jgi:copper(I)-binding protein
MLETFRQPGRGCTHARRRGLVIARARTAGWVAAASAVVLAGCTAHAAERPPIQVGTAYVQQPNAGGTTDAYVVIRNNGPADRLISARSSAGGMVTLRGPAGSGSAMMRTVRDIGIPAGALVRLIPDGFHLLITHSRPMRSGTEITLTLVFARAGSVAVSAQVENPETGGSSYLGD